MQNSPADAPLIDCAPSSENEGGNSRHPPIPPPPPATLQHRHPESDPLNTKRKAMTTCQHCYKSRLEGVKLLVCTGCKVAVYCSKECQKSAWPTHKLKCRINKTTLTSINTDEMTVFQALRTFTAKHKATLSQSACEALEVYKNATNGRDNVLLICLQHRPESKRPETAFYAMGAEIQPFEYFRHKAAEMREQFRQHSEQNEGRGLRGTVMIVLWCVEPRISGLSVCPVGFGDQFIGRTESRDWRTWMFRRLNEGITS